MAFVPGGGGWIVKGLVRDFRRLSSSHSKVAKKLLHIALS